MNKTFENVILGAVVIGLTAAVALLQTAGNTSSFSSTSESLDPDDIKDYIRKKYRQIDDDIDEEHREDVYVGVFNRNGTYIEENAAEEDQEALYKYNERLYNRYY